MSASESNQEAVPFLRRRWNVDRLLLALLLSSCIMLVAVALHAAGMSLALETRRDTPLAFDMDRWRARPVQDDDGQTRRRMAMYLVERAVLDGLSRAEVESMLGPVPVDFKTPETLRYDLGWTTSGFLSFVVHTLRIEFDREGEVVDAMIIESPD